MSNFLEFIKEDIEVKTTAVSSMPTNTKANKEALKKKLTTYIEKYSTYKDSVKKYLDVKSDSLSISEKKDAVVIETVIGNLEYVRSILNPSNTYFEKLGFDNLLYRIGNFHNLKFQELNEILIEFLNKFDIVGIKLKSSDFDYTCYVNEYMTSFLEVRANGNENYEKVLEIFEKIYWINPEIIEHIELTFRKLIRRNEKVFIDYIEKLKRKVLADKKINDYEDLLEKLKSAYIESEISSEESVSDIIELSKDGSIDITHYFEDSKIRVSTYSELMIDEINQNDKELMSTFYKNIQKLNINLKEYKNCLNFSPLIEDFRNEFKKYTSGDKPDSAGELKAIENKILDKEKALDKLNKNIFDSKEKGLRFRAVIKDINKLKIDSLKQAKELYELYKEYDQKYYIDKVLTVLNSSYTLAEWLDLYYSFSYFKKMAISRVFNTENYEEIKKYSDSFDEFARNMTNVIVTGMLIFEETSISRVIVNKYRLYGINIEENSLQLENLDTLIDKIKLLLRIKTVEESETTFEKIWFIVRVEKINAS